MRTLIAAALACLALAPPALAQQQPPLAKIEKVRVGFRPYREEFMANSRFKVGLWTPVFVDIQAGPMGLGPRQPGDPTPFIEVRAADSEDVETVYRVPVTIEPNEKQTFIAYTKVGNRHPDIKVRLHVGSKEFLPPPDRDQTLDVNAHLYLTLGRKIPDFPKTLVGKEDRNQNVFGDEGTNRAVLWEDAVDRLPGHWFGYDAVDLLFLSTENRAFLELLTRPANAEKLRAIAQWVRRGGRLVVPVSYQTQELLNKVLTAPVWQPPLAVVPPADPKDPKAGALQRIPGVEEWGEVQNLRFPELKHAPLAIARLAPDRVPPGAWDVDKQTEDGRPVVARMKYGLGQITFFAFTFEEPAFTDWEGRDAFLRKVVAKLAPRAGQGPNQQDNRGFGRGGGGNDLTTHLLTAMDNFDVRVIPFGFVALFIILYVLIVGPLDFVLLKYVFKRLEWTWITFPAVVVGVSIFAYFTAYALKGQELKINKVDVVDFDLRTDVDAEGRTRSTQAYGKTFFTILSPRIQSYTIGIEPNTHFWGEEPKGVLSADLVSWAGRPDSDAFGMARGGGQGFFRKPYDYRNDASGLDGVPIPVWTTKAFEASWEHALPAAPFTAELSYHKRDADVKLSGTLKSNLAVELLDGWLEYDNHFYRLGKLLPSAKAEDRAVKVSLQSKDKVERKDWLNASTGDDDARPSTSQGVYAPGGIVKQLLFHSMVDNTSAVTNHSHRRLDLGWRVEEYRGDTRARDSRVREAILYARVRFATGSAADLSTDQQQNPLPTRLWLGELPEAKNQYRPPVGFLNQDTYVRAILPVKPAGQ